jgi:hypothetical protein
MQLGGKLYRALPNTLRFSTTGKGDKPGLAFFLPPLLNDGFMKNNWQHKMFGVHY